MNFLIKRLPKMLFWPSTMSNDSDTSKVSFRASFVKAAANLRGYSLWFAENLDILGLSLDIHFFFKTNSSTKYLFFKATLAYIFRKLLPSFRSRTLYNFEKKRKQFSSKTMANFWKIVAKKVNLLSNFCWKFTKLECEFSLFPLPLADKYFLLRCWIKTHATSSSWLSLLNRNSSPLYSYVIRFVHEKIQRNAISYLLG